jgi:hypothetical protein
MRNCVITYCCKWWWNSGNLGHSSVTVRGEPSKLGFRRLARKRSVLRGSGAPDADDPGACLSQPLGVGVDSLVFIHLIPRIDHKIRMVINRLETKSSASILHVMTTN